jgi:hypothetical protein
MKKLFYRFILCAAVFGLLFTLAGCNPASSVPASTPPASSTAASIADYSAYKTVYTGEGSYGGTKAGAYRIIYRADGSSNITYIDYATCSEIYLCNRPNCTHDNESCTSWLPMDGISKDVFAAGDHLVILYHGSASAVDEFGPTSMPHIDIANLDGSERKTLITLDAACEMNLPILSDGNSLVFLTTVVQQTGNVVSSANQLVRIPFDEGKMQVLYDFSADTPQGDDLIDCPWFLYGATDNGFIVKNIAVSVPVKPGQTGIVQEVQQHNIYKLQAQNGKLAMEEVFSYPGGAYGEYLYHNNLYQLTLDDTNVHLSRLDLTTGKKEDIADHLSVGDNDMISFTGVYGGKLVLSSWHDNAPVRVMVDLDTHEVKPCTLTYQEGEQERPVWIFAESKDAYLVVFGCEPYTEAVKGKLGDVRNVQRVRDIYGLIDKQDYWNSVPNYKPLTPLS